MSQVRPHGVSKAYPERCMSTAWSASGFPVWLVEPSFERKRRRVGRVLLKTSREEEPYDSLENARRQLREIREKARTNHRTYLERFKTNLSRYDRLNIANARNVEEAINYIARIAEGTKFISVNKSGVITNELRPQLERQGFRIVDSYYNEFEHFRGKITDYWHLPRLHEKGILGAFDVTRSWANLNSDVGKPLRDYVALLGVNAASAQDGSVFFLQHFSNIQKDLATARKLILVIPIDKIVEDAQDAEVQTRCMGIWGMESMLLDLALERAESSKIEAPPVPDSSQDREIHILLFDNGRSEMLQGNFKDVFLCIGCRACVGRCPIARFMRSAERVWSCKNYLWKFLLREERSLDECLRCESCRVECPLEIDLPHLMLQAQADRVSEYGRPLRKVLTGDPELLAKIGCLFMPFSNKVLKTPIARVFMEKVTGFHRRGALPRFSSETFRSWFARFVEPVQPSQRIAKKVAYYIGCFANYYDVKVAISTVEVLRKIGCEVVLPPQKCCGMPMVANHNFRGARDNAMYNVKSLAEMVARDYDIVTACPSCSLMLKREYLAMIDLKETRSVSEHLWNISDYLFGMIREGKLTLSPSRMHDNIFYHAPCHLRNQDRPAGSLGLLGLIPGVSIAGTSTTCCGMGGTFGLKKEHFEVSKEICSKLVEDIERAQPARVVTDCGMCALQIEDSAGIQVTHPIVLFREAYLRCF